MMILKKSFGKFIFIFVLGFFAFFNAKPVSEVLASPPVCGIKSTEVNGISDTRYHIDDITIQCNPTQIWGSIKSTARLTNDTGRVYNYEKSGGIRQRNADFDRMPGKPQSTGDSGVILKKYNGKTVTSYTSKDNYPSLRYPTPNNSNYTDKVRYK